MSGKRAKWHVARMILMLLCIIAFGSGIFMVNHRQSAVMTMVLSVMVAVMIIFWRKLRSFFTKIRSRRSGRILINMLVAGILLATLYVIVISGFMLGALRGGAPPADATLIILGCQVRGEEPSLMLYLRMDAAVEFLNLNPEAVAVLSGGQGPGEWITEAEAMRRYLVANDISEDRLFIEERSTSTYENIMFSKAVIEEHGLSQNIGVVTNGFHQFRAQTFAKNAGMIPKPVKSATPVYTLLYYWMREIAAVTAQVL